MFDEITVLRETNFFLKLKMAQWLYFIVGLMLFDHWRIQIVLGRQLMDKTYPPEDPAEFKAHVRKKEMHASK